MTTEPILNTNRFTRKERRHSSFVLKNTENNQYIKMTVDMKTDNYHFKDVSLSEATIWKHKTIENVLTFLLINAPQLKTRVELIYRDNKQLKTK